MAIYIRSRPTTKSKALGSLCALTTVGMIFLYPAALLLAPSIPNPLTELVANENGNLELQSLSVLIGVMTVYNFILFAMIFGALSGFRGTDQRLPKDSTVTHRDIASARFLHISQSPSRRVVGMLLAVLAVMLIEVNPVIAITIPHLLIPDDSTPALEQAAVIGTVCLTIGLFAALGSAASRREKIAVCLTPQCMAVVKLFPLPAFRPQRPQHPGGPGILGSREGPSRLCPTHRRRPAGQTSSPLAARPDGEVLTAQRRPHPSRGPARRRLAGRTADTHPARAGGDGHRSDVGA